MHGETRRRRRLRLQRGELGFTVVEMMVALVIVALSLMALLYAAANGVRQASYAKGRDGATQVLNQQLEVLKATDWASTGFYAADAGYVSSYGGEPTVTLTGTRSGTSTAPLPQPANVVVDQTSYAVRQYVTWHVDASAGLATPDPYGTTYDFKHLSVTVSWTIAGVTKSITADALRSPTSTEMTPPTPSATASAAATATASATASGTASASASATASATASTTAGPFTVSSATSSPATQSLDSNNLLTSAITLTATTSQVASSVKVTYSNNAGTQTLQLASGNGTSWNGTIQAGSASGTFTAGTVTLTFTGTTSGGSTASSSSTVTLMAAALPAISVSTPFTVSPALCNNTNGGGNKNNGQYTAATVSTTVLNVKTTDTVKLQYNTVSGGSATSTTTTMSYVSTDGSGNMTFRATIAQGTVLDTSNTKMIVTASRAQDNASASATSSMTVTQKNNCP